ncbi:MAG: hypothetical protein HW405_771 [Candidatus Berkelbacteria bacterium]|nr:hypothetical protein [Candidatus Berkelbacteria bacterium]
MSEGSLVDALKSGHSYGSRDNIQLQSLSFIPGFAYQNVTEARIQFRVRIPEKTRSVKKVNLYRDGVATAVASVSIPKGSAFYDCVLFDPGISGRHTYIVALDDMSLVTSPFRLDIRAPKAKTGDWTTDLFEQAVVRVSKNKPGVGKTEWLEKDEWPVADSSQRFTAPSVLDICAIFHYSGQEKNPPVAFNPGKVGKLVTMPSLPNQLNITVVVTDQRGNKVIEASPGGFYGGNWRYAIISTTAEFRQKGTYKVEVRSQKTDKVIGTSTFIIK